MADHVPNRVELDDDSAHRLVHESIIPALRDEGFARIQLLNKDLARIPTPSLERLILRISSVLGFVVPQSHRNELVAHVTNEGDDYRAHETRGHRTSAGLDFHSDRCDVALLLYVKGAAQGGRVSVISYADAANRLRESDEDVWRELFSPFPFDLRAERIFASPSWHTRPILWRSEGRVRGHYIRRFITDSQRHPDCPRLTEQQLHALDAFDATLEKLRVGRTFAPSSGELLVLSNYQVMHSREAYADSEERAERRLAIRVWVAPFDSERLPPFLLPLSGALGAGSYRGGVGHGPDYLARLGSIHKPQEEVEK
jgi:hypothetical protein